jgi:hypothetical protein
MHDTGRIHHGGGQAVVQTHDVQRLLALLLLNVDDEIHACRLNDFETKDGFSLPLYCGRFLEEAERLRTGQL